ncbi:hypothetical protein ACFQGE_13280 [Halomicroarcula sp. GCM10025817]|uniref:DUF7344 domain-containing protein n=1 Tax=Haloarcula TaxID=2237 RepID=UPI0023E8C8CF|nr:hypothetical protein [Halomicroarcula sp. SYNS111]
MPAYDHTSEVPETMFPLATADVTLTDTERHQLLASERRRLAIDVLCDLDAPVALSDLAAEIASREQHAGRSDADLVETVSIALHHNHLPKMGALGILDYAPETNTVEAVRVQ